MILDGVDPSSILLFTFTNKAAKEIKERISKGVGEENANRITMGTYHSFCCRLLRKYADKIGFKRNFSILDSEDSEKILKDIVKGSQVDHKFLGAFIDGAKRKLLTPKQALSYNTNTNDTLVNMYDQYQKELKCMNSMDFNDLIFNAVKLLEQNDDVRAQVNNKYKYISADEFHDSSSVDIRLIKLLAGEEENVCHILDDAQSIYSFRGADIEAVLNTRDLYKDVKIYNLNQNYRCSNTIVEASKNVIRNNSIQLEKNIYTSNADGDKIIVYEEKTPQHEGFRIAKTIELLVNKYDKKYKDIAILFRTGSQTRSVEEALIKSKIPYSILAGINFFQREEIKDIVSYFKVIVNANNFEAFRRAVNVPKRGIGAATVEKVIEECKSHIQPIDIITAIQNVISAGTVKGKAKEGLEDFIDVLYETYCVLDEEGIPEALGFLIGKIKYYEYLEKNDKTGDVFEGKIENVIELINMSYEYLTIEEFIEQASLGNNEDTNDADGKVQLLTMHMSKGLEWEIVFMAGCNEGVIPHFRSLGSPKQIEEERRVFYVAMTRAKKNLFITRPLKVNQGGFYKPTKVSQFVMEIDRDLIFSSNS